MTKGLSKAHDIRIHSISGNYVPRGRSVIGSEVAPNQSLLFAHSIVETAAGIHPGFNGCLTLELANVGEVPIKIRPGMKIAQVFVHELLAGEYLSKGQFKGRRRPYLGSIPSDLIMEKLSSGKA
jgi:dUTPase